MTTAATTVGERILFDAVLEPHRSLSPEGFRLLMVCVALGGLGIGTFFLLAGAWPVFGFCGLEVLLFYGLFRLNYRQARLREYVTLTQRISKQRNVIDPSSPGFTAIGVRADLSRLRSDGAELGVECREQ